MLYILNRRVVDPGSEFMECLIRVNFRMDIHIGKYIKTCVLLVWRYIPGKKQCGEGMVVLTAASHRVKRVNSRELP